jgi:hypothetical protein
MTWYDGGEKLPEDKRSYKDRLYGEKARGSGLLLVGDKGSYYTPGDNGADHVLLPKEQFKDVKQPEPSLPRTKGHFTEWVEGIRANDPHKPMSNFQYAGRLTETVLLGVVALKAGKRIEWDAEEMRAKNCPEASDYIRRDYRRGYSIH